MGLLSTLLRAVVYQRAGRVPSIVWGIPFHCLGLHLLPKLLAHSPGEEVDFKPVAHGLKSQKVLGRTRVRITDRVVREAAREFQDDVSASWSLGLFMVLRCLKHEEIYFSLT